MQAGIKLVCPNAFKNWDPVTVMAPVPATLQANAIGKAEHASSRYVDEACGRSKGFDGLMTNQNAIETKHDRAIKARGKFQP